MNEKRPDSIFNDKRYYIGIAVGIGTMYLVLKYYNK